MSLGTFDQFCENDSFITFEDNNKKHYGSISPPSPPPPYEEENGKKVEEKEKFDWLLFSLHLSTTLLFATVCIITIYQSIESSSPFNGSQRVVFCEDLSATAILKSNNDAAAEIQAKDICLANNVSVIQQNQMRAINDYMQFIDYVTPPPSHAYSCYWTAAGRQGLIDPLLDLYTHYVHADTIHCDKEENIPGSFITVTPLIPDLQHISGSPTLRIVTTPSQIFLWTQDKFIQVIHGEYCRNNHQLAVGHVIRLKSLQDWKVLKYNAEIHQLDLTHILNRHINIQLKSLQHLFNTQIHPSYIFFVYQA